MADEQVAAGKEQVQAIDWRKAITNTILDEPDIAPYDPKAGRAELVAVVERVKNQIANNSTKAPNRMWRTRQDGAIVVALKLDGEPIHVTDADGTARSEFAIPKGQAVEVLGSMIEAIRDTDEFDDEIRMIFDNRVPGTKKSKTAKTPKASKPRAASSKSGAGSEKPWQSRADWGTITFPEKQIINANYRRGMNPDRSLIADEGHKPDAPIVGNPKKKKG